MTVAYVPPTDAGKSKLNESLALLAADTTAAATLVAADAALDARLDIVEPQVSALTSANVTFGTSISASGSFPSANYGKLTQVTANGAVITFPTAVGITNGTLIDLWFTGGAGTANGVSVQAGGRIIFVAVGSAWVQMKPFVAGGGLDAEAVQDVVAAMVVQGSGITISYNDGANTLTFSASGGTPSVSIAGPGPGPEGNSGTNTRVFTVTRTSTVGAISVPYTTTFGTGITGADFSGGTLPATSGNISIVDGSATGTLTYTVAGDVTVEGDETITVTITAPGGYSLGSPSSATATISNDDSSSTLWDPTQLGSAVVAWWDASNTASLTMSGSNVTTWASRVGSISATVPSGASPGTYNATGQNGQPSVVFGAGAAYEGSDATFPSGSTASTISVTAYLDYAAAVNDQFPFVYGTASTANARTVGTSQQSGALVGVADTYGNALAASPTSWNNETRNQIWQLNGTAGSLSTDGNAAVTGSQTTNTILDHFSIGRYGPNYGQVRGHIQEIILVNRVLTTTERQKLEGYEAWHWNRVASLPVGHPYKSAAPTV